MFACACACVKQRQSVLCRGAAATVFSDTIDDSGSTRPAPPNLQLSDHHMMNVVILTLSLSLQPDQRQHLLQHASRHATPRHAANNPAIPLLLLYKHIQTNVSLADSVLICQCSLHVAAYYPFALKQYYTFIDLLYIYVCIQMYIYI